MQQCRECGAAQLVQDDVGSLVCTVCGTLADPAQAVLADHHDHQTAPHAPPRTSKGWLLAQTKQDRDRRNTIAMSTFISSVLSRLNNPGLSPRAEAIFTQAMSLGHYRWGRKAKLTAGAAISIALREARKSDSLPDIAFLLDESPVSISRAFQAVVSLLDFSLAATDPAVHLPILHAHLQSILHPETPAPSASCHLPKSLVAVLAHLSLHVAVRTASSLSLIVLQQSPPVALSNLPTPPTACALFILGLEAEARAPLPHLGELTRTLATRFALAPGVVSSRYKTLYDLIEEWIRHVPWLDQFVYKGKGRGAAARSKVPKRTIVAKGIKDVIQFHQEINQSRMQRLHKVTLDLEYDPAEGEEEGDGDDGNANSPTVASPESKRINEFDVGLPPRKRHRAEKKGDAMQAAYRFLRDPLSSGSLDAAVPDGPVGETSLLTRVLTCAPEQLSRTRGPAPTRLQQLAAARGGSTPEDIADEELFAEGELEGLLRDEREREALEPLFQLNWGEEASTEEAATHDRKSAVVEPKRGAKRVDMDALARLLGSDRIESDNADEEDVSFPDVDDPYLYLSPGEQVDSGAEVVSDWRPGFPDDDDDVFGAFHHSTEDRYDEEL